MSKVSPNADGKSTRDQHDVLIGRVPMQRNPMTGAGMLADRDQARPGRIAREHGHFGATGSCRRRCVPLNRFGLHRSWHVDDVEPGEGPVKAININTRTDWRGIFI
jgi:hypothetical protein